MSIVYVLVNDSGIMLGIYRDYTKALVTIKDYQENEDICSPIMYLYKITSDQADLPVKNRFKCIWMSEKNEI